MAVTADRPIAGAAAAFAALAVVASARDGGWLADADRALFKGVRAHRGRARTVVARIISAFGEPAGRYSAPRTKQHPPEEAVVDVEVVVEIPQGSRNKYEMDHATGRMRLDRMLFTSTCYPLDYGFIPDTLAEDGDPLDALVMLDEPTFPGCLVLARPVAVFWMHDEHGPDAKILTVPARDPRYADRHDLGDVPGHLIAEIGHFFYIYKELEPGKSTDVRGWQDRAAAEQVIDASFARGRGSAAGLGEVQSFRDRPPGSPVGDAHR